MKFSSPADGATFRSLMQAAPDGILVCDAAGIIVLANDQCADLFGYEIAELHGQPIEILVPDYVRARHAKLRDGYLVSPHRRPMGIGLDLVAKRKDGTTVPVEVSLSPFEINGQPCVISVVRDVTEIRRLNRDLKHFNDQLRRSNEELEKFAYVASHDLQEPLRMVAGYAQLLKRRYSDRLDSDANEYIDYAVDGVKRMQTLINDLLTYSRLSTKPKPFQSINLNDIVLSVVANLGVAIADAKATVAVDELPMVLGDGVQLTQVLQNLVSNALKFHRPGASLAVHVSARRDGAFWEIAVADNGIGIESQHSQRIFVIFQRLHSREQYPGTGIGLAICMKVVERHGGRIWFDSVVGEGTVFRFTLPAVETSP